jgi:hypothetical protein
VRKYGVLLNGVVYGVPNPSIRRLITESEYIFILFFLLLFSPSTTFLLLFFKPTDLRRNHRFWFIFFRRTSSSVNLEVDTLDRRCRWLLPLSTSWTSVETFSSIVSIAMMLGNISTSSFSFSVEIFSHEMKWTVSSFCTLEHAMT